MKINTKINIKRVFITVLAIISFIFCVFFLYVIIDGYRVFKKEFHDYVRRGNITAEHNSN